MASLGIGDRLGAYEILAAVGAGGMGEVYRARDTRLKRDVAIKCLPEAWAENHARRQRFTQEAHAIAQLTHPHICTLYDVAFERGRLFLVMELLEGETLARRLLRRGEGVPLERQQALSIATELAEALAYAHKRGIVHRDLKPANIFLTKTGVKLLDFGLAKLREIDEPDADHQTRTVLTGEQQVLGTLPYMSPEQLEGRADKRSDIFAFGAVLFEMLTGRRAFEGHSGSIITAAIVSHDPMRTFVAERGHQDALTRVLGRCLNKDPDDRWQSAADLADELGWIRDAGRHQANDSQPASATKRFAAPVVSRWTWIAGTALVAAIVAGIAGFQLASSVPARVERPATPQRFTISLPPHAPIYRERALAISADGQQVAYVSSGDGTGQPRLYLRTMNAFDPRPLERTEGAYSPFFSPDGQAIAFFAGGALKRISFADGAVSTICYVKEGGFRSGAWGPDGVIVFNGPEAERSGMYRVTATGGAPERLTTPTEDEGVHSSPTFAGDGKTLLFVTGATRAGVTNSVMAFSFNTGRSVRVVEGTNLDVLSRPFYTDSGQLLFKRGTALVAAPFDLASLRLTGPGVPIAENISDYAVSATGRLVFVQNVNGGRLTWVARDGTNNVIIEDGRSFEMPRLSPDGTMLAATMIRELRGDLAIYRFANRFLTRLTDDGSNSATWSPDSKRLVYRVSGGRLVIQTVPIGAQEPLLDPTDPRLKGASGLAPGAFTPDGSAYIFVIHQSLGTAADIWKLELTGQRRVMPLVERKRDQWGVRVSPDGRWISYASNESGPWEIYIEPISGGGARHKVSADEGTEATEAVWSRDGGTLFYRANTRMMAAPIKDDTAAPVEEPQVVFSGNYAKSPLPHYDVTADGKRFVMIQPPEVGRTIQVMDGWQPR